LGQLHTPPRSLFHVVKGTLARLEPFWTSLQTKKKDHLS